LPAKKNILLISYVFPPHYGIGGRRWVKHANELTKLGYRVHVICAKNPFSKDSLWHDIIKKNRDIILHQLPSRYPKVLVDFNHSLIQKIYYRFFVLVLPLFTKGSFLDRTIFWKNIMLREARQIISENNIKHVISTGGPFGAMYFATLLRKWFNDIFILNDLRDPWTWGPNWGFTKLSKKRMAFEERREYETMRDSDIISTPSDDIVRYLKDVYPEFKSKFIQIPHFFDSDEILVEKKTSSEKIRFIMYGNIYQDIEQYIRITAELMVKYKDSIVLDIFTDKKKHADIFQEAGASNVHFYDQVPANELFSKFKNYDFVFLFNPDYNRHNISTKFYEIIYTKTPILLFCANGKGPEFITSNNLGLHGDISNIGSLIERLITDRSSFKYNYDYNVDEYSLQNVTKNISNILEQNNIFVSDSAKNRVKNILLTFDYELFLGERSGTVENCILKPTVLILESLKKHKLKKAIFFVDTSYLWRLEKINDPKAKSDLLSINQQLKEVLLAGHYIFPHIHTHWIDATYQSEINQWNLSDQTKYRFHTISLDLQKYLFSYSLNYIKQIQKDAGVDYPIDSYRAGGWCIQPFADFKGHFLENNIKNDFSVLKDFSLTNDDSYYNFESTPSRLIYKFNTNVEMQDLNGIFKEYSITSIQISEKRASINRLFNKFIIRMGYRNYGDGRSAKRVDQAIIDETSENAYQTKRKIEMTSIELMTIVKKRNYKRLIEHNSYIHFISHPKMISKHNLFCFNKFIEDVRANYEIETDFRKMNTENA
jgi:hypothetical protein